MGNKPTNETIIPECTVLSNTFFLAVEPYGKPEPNQNFEIKENEVHFYPVRKKGENYKAFCTGLLDYEPDIKETVMKYTSGPDWYCTKVNFALGLDSVNLKDYAQYIRELKYCIGKYGTGYEGVLLRGVDLSDEEISEFEKMGEKEFYIPSFTSASTTKPFDKNTILKIHCNEKKGFALKIRSEWTRFPHENEVLMSCYNVYQRMGEIQQEDDKRVINVKLLDYHEYHDDYNNTHSLENGKIKQKTAQ